MLCIRDYEGNEVDTLWEVPGGIMTMLQFSSNQPILLATQKFYLPNDSAEAKIVHYTRNGGKWVCHVLCDFPFVHRFGIVSR